MIYFNERQKEIAQRLSSEASETDWKDWKWQIKHSIKDIDTFEKLLGVKFNEVERKKLKKTLAKFPLSITPYYLSLIDPKNFRDDPVYKQAFPSVKELQISNYEMNDPLAEDQDSPVPGITHRYPDRVLLYISHTCSMYCRHCTRKRKVGDKDSIPSKSEITKGIAYIKKHPQIRDVLLSGGDPLMLADEYLDWIIGEIKKIPHVQVIRIGTRMPVVLPYRITDKLVAIFKKYSPLWINTHFNHPREITPSSCEALRKLADAGIPLGNQSVLLAGVNDCSQIMKNLVHKLVENRVRPYYIYQCDLSEGLNHFRTSVSKGVEIMENLIGHTSGFAVPTFVVDAPGGGGKIPVTPNYLVSWSANKVILRNYEGVITTYQEPENYRSIKCNNNCQECDLQLIQKEKEKQEFIGIARLMSDTEKAISLTPQNTERFERRAE